MVPRNNEMNAKRATTTNAKPCLDERDSDLNLVIPSLLHKKHRVVKLIRSQLKQIHEEGFINNLGNE